MDVNPPVCIGCAGPLEGAAPASPMMLRGKFCAECLSRLGFVPLDEPYNDAPEEEDEGESDVAE